MKKKTEPIQLKGVGMTERRRGVGGDDVVALMGLHKYGKTPFDIYQRIVNGVKSPPNKFMETGLEQEPIIANRFMKKNEVQLKKPDFVIYHHPDEPLLMVAPDFFTDTKELEIVETKFTTQDIEQTEPAWFVQLQWQFHILGVDKGWLAWMVNAIDYFQERFTYDYDFAMQCEIKARDFIENHLKPEICPEPTSLVHLEMLYPKALPTAIEATDEIVEAIRVLNNLKAEQKETEEIRAQLEFIIKDYIKDNEVLQKDGKILATYENVSKKGFDSKALQEAMPDVYEQFQRDSSYRLFLPKK